MTVAASPFRRFLVPAAALGVLLVAPARAEEPPLAYPVVDTGQSRCFDDRREVPPPARGAPFHGQDAQHVGRAPDYVVSKDGVTVLDRATGLTWQRGPDTDGDGTVTHADKRTWAQAQAQPARLNAARHGGFDDWRLPTIKELYSLFDARGTDPSGPSEPDTKALRPYLDTAAFRFAYGDPRSGERVIDSQYASSTTYVGPSPRGPKVFGVNFADGRIKGYDLRMPGGGEKTFFVQCVRGNPKYGRNDFRDEGDGTVTDRATGLTWTKADSGAGMDWKDALAWVARRNAEKHLGHDDWRLPDVKELQSLVDYGRSPDTTRSAAIDPVFTCTEIRNEAGQSDYPYYWSSTTHEGLRGGDAAMYVAFGRACGWLGARGPGPGGPPPGGPPGPPPGSAPAGEPRYVDVHGAGAQRSDPKSGDPAAFPRGRGPQGDVIRIRNFVRLVRGGTSGR